MKKMRLKRASVFNNYSPNYKQKRIELYNLLKKHNFIPQPQGDFVIVVGGDGTFLSAVHEKWRDNIPLAPVNDGNLGFFSEYTLKETERFIKLIEEGEYVIEELPLYDFEIHHSDGRITKDIFLNDLTIKQLGGKVIHLDLVINKQHVFPYSCDGLLISSFIGSTAYNKSLNSSVMFDKINTFQVTPIAPVNNKKYSDGTSNPIILNDTNYIEIMPSHKKKRQSLVVADNKEFQLKNGIKKIVIKNSFKKIKIIRTKNFNHQKNILDKVF